MVTIFWLSIFSIFYAYFGYPLVLFIISLFRSFKVAVDNTYCPLITLIITVHNEEKRIQQKIQNTFALEYPKEKLEVIFASDASTDATDEIIQKYQDQGLNLVRSPKRGGKELAQKCAIDQSAGEIIVFTDVATMLEKDGLRKIVSNFADSSVGCVSSEDRFINPDGTISGEGAYVRYEMWLRSLESSVNSVVGLSGSFFAARKDVCRNWPITIPSDFNTLLNTIRTGYRGISDPHSVGIYNNIKDEEKEFDRKVRTITRGISALMANTGLMNPFRYGLFSWQLVSHKLIRWLAPWFLIIACASHLVLAWRNCIYRILLIPHILFYILSLLGALSSSRVPFLKIPFYFFLVNKATALSWIKYLMGKRFVVWDPSTR